MEYNVFDEKNVTVIKCNFIVPVERPHTIVSYNMHYNKTFANEKEIRRYIADNKLNVINQYELYYYDLKAMCSDTENMGFLGLNMRAASIIAYQKNRVRIERSALKAGNRYVLRDGTEILFLGQSDERYHYLSFAEYIKRMNEGKSSYDQDNPQKLRKRTTTSYKKMPVVIGDLGPYWNNNAYTIEKNKIFARNEDLI